MLDQVLDGFFGPVEEQLASEFAEQRSEFILFDELLGLLIFVKSLLFVHDYY